METIFGKRYFASDFYMFSDLLGFVYGGRDVVVTDIHKSRRGFTYAGCIAEIAVVTVAGLTLESFSLEHEDAELIIRALAMLGLDSRTNTSYPEWLVNTNITSPSREFKLTLTV